MEFIASNVAVATALESTRHEGWCESSDPIGSLALADLVGLDVFRSVIEVFFGRPR